MLRRTPLRVQLVAALLSLVSLGLFVSGIAATTALRNYLLQRVDDQLVDQAETLSRRPHRGQAGPRAGLEPDSPYFVELTDETGTFIDQLEKTGATLALPRVPRTEVIARRGKPFTFSSSGQQIRVLAIPVTLTAGPRAQAPGSLTIGTSLGDVQDTVRRLVLIELIVGGGVLLLLGGLGYGVVRSSLRPLGAVETTAAAIAAGDLSRRVPERDPRTEVGRLSRSLNAMLAQIESAFRARETSEASARASEQRMRRFVADASHELRTPLTSIRGFAELYRQGAVSDATDISRSMQRIEDEAARMGLLVDDLLLLARLDQQRPLERAPVELLALAADAVHDANAAWPDRNVQLRVLPGGVLPVVLGDEARLRQVFGNLVSNAVTHTSADARAVVTVGTDGADAVLEVSDTGPGLSPEAAARVFERFYRADTSRTRAAGGTGLGLSIVAALVAAHGGTVAVETAPGEGSTFRVRLPLATSSDNASEPAPLQ
ncbi:MAG: HAMP domain-containing sensor histidine kinase [Mycobacteriales bacterium]